MPLADWQRNALKWGLLGGLGGAGTSLLLNTIYHAQNNRKPVDQLVPSSILDQPYYVDDEQAKTLEEQGIKVNPGIKTAREALYAHGRCLSDAVRKHVHLPKVAWFEEYMEHGIKNGTVPILSALGAGYAGFRGVDYLMDSMAKDTAKSRYEKKRKELEQLMAQMHGGVSKVAEDYVDGGRMVATVPATIAAYADGLALSKTAEGKSWRDIIKGGWNSALGAGDDVGKSYATGFIGIPLAIAALMSFPKAVEAFRTNNPNNQAVTDIEEHYKDMPEHPQVRMVPTRRAAPAVKPPKPAAIPMQQPVGEEADKLNKVAGDATASQGTSSSTVTPDLTPKADTPAPASNMGPSTAAGSPFSGRFSMRSGGRVNVPMAKVPPKKPAVSLGTPLG